MALEILFNHEQTRIAQDRLPLIARGGEIELQTLRSGCWVEPSHNRILLEPYCITDAWVTSNSGNYAKLALASFTQTGTWETRTHTGLITGPWLAIADTAGTGSLVTTTTYSKNRGFWVAAHVYAQTKGVKILEGGWNSTSSSASGVAFELYSNGLVIILKDGAEVGRGKVAVQHNQTVELLLLPYAHRELLVYSPDGEGEKQRGSAFSVLFDDLAEDASDPTITGGSKFWLKVPNGGTQVMAAPVLFPSSGYCCSLKQSFMQAPSGTDTLEEWVNESWVGAGPFTFKAYGHPAYVSTQTIDIDAVDWAGSAFTANGTNIESRLKFTLGTSDTGYSPTIYGGQLAYGATFGQTDDSEVFDATNYCLHASLSVPEEADGVSLSLHFKSPATLEADIPNFRRATNLPVKFSVDGVIVIDGRSNSPRWIRSTVDGASVVEIDVDQGWKGMRNYRYAEPLPLDQLYLTSQLVYFAGHAGIESTNATITTSTFKLPTNTNGEVDGWSLAVEPGDTPSDWAQRLIDDYAATWIHGIRPKVAAAPEYFALDPTDVGTTAAVTLWRSAADSLDAAKGNHATNPERWVYQLGASVETLEPEATEVRVTGYDPITDRLLQSFKVDTAAETVSTAPSSRPTNWVGEKRRFGLENGAISSQSVCNDATEILYDRLTPTRELVEWEGFFLTVAATDRPLWRGDVVRLEGLGYYKIISFGGEWVANHGLAEYEQFRYVGEKVASEPS